MALRKIQDVSPRPIRSHSLLDDLLADDHTQYALLAGRSGGQILYGGSGASENLRLVSTSNATLGNIRCASNTVPHTSNTYDLGTSSLLWKLLYTAEGLTINANQYAFKVNATTSGLYFNASPPRYIGFHINGVAKHLFYQGASGDEGGYWRVLRTSDPTNATLQGTEYTYDNGLGDAWGKIRSQGVWVDVQQREVISVTPSATITFTHNEHTDIFSTWEAGENETVNASGTQKAGQNMHLVIECDGTARTITFGTGFRANGKCVLTINKGDVLHFVSNGTDWCEVSRTKAI